VNIGYQVMTGTDERDSVKKFTALLANLLAIVTGRSLQELNRRSAGRLVFGELGIGVSGVLAIIRLEAILN